MIYYMGFGLLIISVLLALLSLRKQKELEELKTVRKELKKSRVIFTHHSSSSVSK
jgi:hypothetical protein